MVRSCTTLTRAMHPRSTERLTRMHPDPVEGKQRQATWKGKVRGTAARPARPRGVRDRCRSRANMTSPGPLPPFDVPMTLRMRSRWSKQKMTRYWSLTRMLWKRARLPRSSSSRLAARPGPRPPACHNCARPTAREPQRQGRGRQVLSAATPCWAAPLTASSQPSDRLHGRSAFRC